ncbi:hypothetical protein PV08_08597 [Exophiala spinifera]|uniref:PRISE-like Rossmann-fold domain-containing protein n=1 Tax=Exophiala spinifera TaxID=91928 RepID=A0A0D2BQK0_9EURO|nr:uncharacterized protein PV08_08597 [Exophiala spinifera]KIW13409.1 hypothetical protein PV08_08597 [Exophiala spinifera]
MSEGKVHSEGIYHGLPSFPQHEGKQYTALVLGSSGITGAYIVEILSKSPYWKKIVAVSRSRPHFALPDHVQHLSIDLLQDHEVIGKTLSENDVKADYVFFSAYIQPPTAPGEGLWSNEQELERLNVKILENLLLALDYTGSIPKRFLLQTGAKHYGVHLGPTLTPMEESDPRYLGSPNFYFPQEDLLAAWCKKHGTSWNVTRPGFIIGAVPNAAMNEAYGLAVYASVQAEMGEGLEYPGTIAAWGLEKHLSAARLIAWHAEWAVLTAQAKNQALNISDDSMFTYGKFWPVLASWYGVSYGTPPEPVNSVQMPYTPPPRGFGEAGKVEFAWSFQEWALRDDVQNAWRRIAERHSLVKNPFDNVTDVFGILDGDISGPWARSISMGKSRELGWHGYVNSHAAIFQTISELAELKMVPPIPNKFDQVVKYVGY